MFWVLLMMRKYLLFMLLCLVLATAAHAAGSTTQLYMASDGAGGVRLLWWIPPERWRPGGFRLEDDQGNVLRAQIGPGSDEEAMQQLSEADRKQVLQLENSSAAGAKDSSILLGIQTLGNWQFARALGLASEQQGLAERPTGFVIRGLGRDGKPDGSYLESKPIDLARATPLHTPPVELRGENGTAGVTLYWRRPAHHLLPILAYRIERSSDEGSIDLTPEPLVLGSGWTAEKPAFVDSAPPLEREVNYLVTAIDVLGRPGPPAELSLFVADRSALQAPAGIEAHARDDKIEISWQANPSPNTTGYVVERSPLLGGPYEVLTPKGITAKQTRYSDTPPPRASALYYRVRAIDPRGEVGEPGNAVLARLVADPPPAPSRIRAEAGHTRARLSWDPVPGAEGYQVERRTDGGEWQALGNLLIREPRLDDPFAPVDGLRLEYRVSAVAWGDATGPASKPVKVEIPDTLPPQPPAIVAAESENGSVLLRFHPAAPEQQTRQMLVLRGGAEDPGLVIGDPLPGDSREWRDSWVLPGETYWYRLVALDAAGNRSDAGEPVRVRVANARIPQPARPEAAFREQPFRHVRLRFHTPPDDYQVIVQRAIDANHWQALSGPQGGEEAVDADPPTNGKARYRLLYRAANGAFGPGSDTVEVTLP